MAIKTLPEVQVICYPSSAIPKRTRDPFNVTDILSDRMNRSGGDSMGPSPATPSLNAQEWQEQSASQTIRQWVERTNVDFAWFHADGTFEYGAGDGTIEKGDVGGYVLSPTELLQDCIVGGSGPDNGNQQLPFTAILGRWISITNSLHPNATALLNNGGDLLGIVQTTDPVLSNLSFGMAVNFAGHASGTVQPGFRVTWGNSAYSIVMRQGQKATVEQMVNGQWQVWGQLKKSPVCDLQRGRYRMSVQRLNGRLVVHLNGQGYWFQKTVKGVGDNQPTPVDVVWGAGPLNIHAFNVRCVISCLGLKYLTPDNDIRTGTFTRLCRPKTPPPAGTDNSTYNTRHSVSGWLYNGTKADLTVDQSGLPAQLTYQCTLRPSLDGVDTPFVAKVGLFLDPTWPPVSAGGIDITPAVKTITVSRAKPPLQPGATATVEIDRALLDAIYPNGSWTNNVDRWLPISIAVRWHYDDGSRDSWSRLIRGYVQKVTKSTVGVGTGTMTLQVQDPSVRLRKPAAVIDYHYHPLDYVLSVKSTLGTAPRPNELLPSDCVRDILLKAIGPEESDRLQVVVDNELPLLSYDNDFGGTIIIEGAATGKPMTQNGPMLPPPFGEDCLSWINKLLVPQRLVFYYGTDGDPTSDWPVPIIGRILDIQRAGVTRTIYDASLVSGSLLMQATQTDTHPDVDVNRILVLAASPADNQVSSFVPSLSWAEQILPSTDPNSRERTWERTKIVRNELAWLSGNGKTLAQLTADGWISLLTGVNPIWPVIKCRGDAAINWGDKVQCLNWNDTTLGVGLDPNSSPPNQQQVFRVEQVSHTIDLWNPGPSSWQTTLSVRPITRGGL